MLRYLPFFFLFFGSDVFGQNFNGQWKGTFIDKSTSFINWGGDQCDYVLELQTNGNKVTGYSYTYFTDNGKKFYTICSLEGFIDRRKRYVEVKETSRTKTNVPVHIRNCFQVHKLTWSKSGNDETLTGNWVPVPRQEGDCGFGFTTLTRRVLRTNIPRQGNVARNETKKPAPKVVTAKTSVAKPPSKTKVAETATAKVSEPLTADNRQKEIKLVTEVEKPSRATATPEILYRSRNTNLLKVLEVQSEKVKVDLYDNGQIDGDSISLFYNGNMLVSKQRLTDKPITFHLEVDHAGEMNELVMYAENLGSIPPNTALMVVTDGPRRYEVRITSDLQKSGTIHFLRRQ
jgi:hypothetical protein